MKRVNLHPLTAERAREALDEHARQHRAAAIAEFPSTTDYHITQARLSESASDDITRQLKKIRQQQEAANGTQG